MINKLDHFLKKFNKKKHIGGHRLFPFLCSIFVKVKLVDIATFYVNISLDECEFKGALMSCY